MPATRARAGSERRHPTSFRAGATLLHCGPHHRAGRWREPRSTRSTPTAVLSTARVLGSLLLSKRRDRARTLYDLLSTNNVLGERSLYLNLGYWDGARGYDEACEALARVLADAAALGPGDRVLDVGFGFGDQDMYWATAFGPLELIGLNITASQVRIARERVATRGFAGLELLPASATAMPLRDSSVDVVVALESAHHFVTRESFFREAFRVLRPGGRLALADIATRGELRVPWWRRPATTVFRGWTQLPEANIYPAGVYERKLVSAGFERVQLRSIREHVFEPLAAFVRRRTAEREFKRRTDPLIRWLVRIGFTGRPYPDYDYVIASARKPDER